MKAPATMPDNLNSIPRTHMIEGENQLPTASCLLASVHMRVHTHKQMNVRKKVHTDHRVARKLILKTEVIEIRKEHAVRTDGVGHRLEILVFQLLFGVSLYGVQEKVSS